MDGSCNLNLESPEVSHGMRNILSNKLGNNAELSLTNAADVGMTHSSYKFPPTFSGVKTQEISESWEDVNHLSRVWLEFGCLVKHTEIVTRTFTSLYCHFIIALVRTGDTIGSQLWNAVSTFIQELQISSNI